MLAYRSRWLKVSMAIVVTMLILKAPGRAQDTRVGKLTGNVKHGKDLFRRYCVGCHGERGNGEGDNAPYVNPEFPKPRDFTTGLFKCRSTPSGSIPLDSDIFDALSRGIHATAMPAWSPLTKQQRVDLLAYIKSFSPRFKMEKAEPPVEILPETAFPPESLGRGRELYQTLKCAECHGPEGRGNGPSAPSLRDNKGNPLLPYDFTVGLQFKCGHTNLDLARIFLTGLDGTPMPSYVDYLQGAQVWDLVHYLQTLQTNYKGPGKTVTGTPVVPVNPAKGNSFK